MPETLLDKIWDLHVIKHLASGEDLLHVDRHFLIDLGSNYAFEHLKAAGRKVNSPQLTFAVPDHIIASDQGRKADTFADGFEFLKALRSNTWSSGIRLFDLDDPEQGIVHVVGPELAIALPGTLMVTGDSHTATLGGLGAMGFGIGTSDVEHVLATQTLIARKPKSMRVTFTGDLPAHVSAKDMILYLIGLVSISGGAGFALEYAGDTVESLSVEGRLTLCNMSIELGARVGMVAPDEKTFSYLQGRAYAPQGELWEMALAHWQSLHSDKNAVFDAEFTIDASTIAPQVTWGTTPMDVIAVTGNIPNPAEIGDTNLRESMERKLKYMGLQGGTPIEGVKIDWAFIGSCTNSRLSDLRIAANIVRGKKVAKGVNALVVPGSTNVKKQAEALGLDQVFLDAGFEWRESACSLCAGMNADVVGPGERSLSTSNRNFEGRQGAGARTHLASPAMVAAAAISGVITNVSNLS